MIRHEFPSTAREIASRILDEDHKLAILALIRDESLLRSRAEGIQASLGRGAAAAEWSWWEGWGDDQWSPDQWSPWTSRPGWSGSDSSWQEAYPREPAPRGTVDEEFRWGNASWR
jgi:hypothetical protein